MKFNLYLYTIFVIAMMGIWGAFLFLVAGTWSLPFFWAVLGVQLLLGLVSIAWLDPELLAERMNPKGKDKDPWGRLILTILSVGQGAIAALDVGRWNISSMPLIVQIIAFALMCFGWWGFMWSMRINRFFSSAIRLQPDRGQQVITAGPYHWIRHPGYAFGTLGFVSQGIALGSWLSVVPAFFIVCHLIYRTLLEERLLSESLAGYKQYMQDTRYRWLPGVW